MLQKEKYINANNDTVHTNLSMTFQQENSSQEIIKNGEKRKGNINDYT